MKQVIPELKKMKVKLDNSQNQQRLWDMFSKYFGNESTNENQIKILNDLYTQH